MFHAKRIYPITQERVENELLGQVNNSSYNLVLSIIKKLEKTMNLQLDLSKFRYRKTSSRVKHYEELLTREEIYLIIQNARTTEASAAIAVLWDGALRASELLSIKSQNIRQDEYGYVVVVDGKTGTRPVRLIESSGFLSAYLRQRGDEPGRIFAHTSAWLRGHIYRATSRARIKKRVYPHLLRHTRLTELSQKLPRQAFTSFAGWVNDTGMDTIYVHLSQSDIDEAVLKASGIIKEKTDNVVRRCPRCHILTPSQSHCCNCGSLLKVEADDFEKLKLETLMSRVLQDPDVQRVVISKLKDILEKQKRL